MLTGLSVPQTFSPAHSPIHSLESSEASSTNLIGSIYLGMGRAVRCRVGVAPTQLPPGVMAVSPLRLGSRGGGPPLSISSPPHPIQPSWAPLLHPLSCRGRTTPP